MTRYSENTEPKSIDRLLTLYRVFSTDDADGRLVLALPVEYPSQDQKQDNHHHLDQQRGLYESLSHVLLVL